MESPTTVEPQALEHGDLLAHDAVPAALISMRDIWRTYEMGTEQLHALRGVSFDVQRGEYLAIIGPSGSGKSTLMNLIGCLDTPSQGRYWINSKLVSRWTTTSWRASATRRSASSSRRSTSWRAPPLCTTSSCRSSTPASRPPTARERAVRSLGSVELSDRMTHRPNELSGGQRQSVAIARALVNNPSILLADEPTGALDSKTSARDHEPLREICTRTGNTIIVVTHEHDIAERAHRVISIRDGQIEKDERIK